VVATELTRTKAFETALETQASAQDLLRQKEDLLQQQAHIHQLKDRVVGYIFHEGTAPHQNFQQK
jgi:hypothetical protein